MIVLEQFRPIVQDLAIGLFFCLFLTAIAPKIDSKCFLSKNLLKILENKKPLKVPIYKGFSKVNDWSWWRDLNPWPLPYQLSNYCQIRLELNTQETLIFPVFFLTHKISQLLSIFKNLTTVDNNSPILTHQNTHFFHLKSSKLA